MSAAAIRRSDYRVEGWTYSVYPSEQGGFVRHPQYGYMQSPLEAIAFDLQARFEQGVPLLSVADRVARHAAEARDAASAVFQMHGLELGA